MLLIPFSESPILLSEMLPIHQGFKMMMMMMMTEKTVNDFTGI